MLRGDETKHAGVELMQVWCYQRGLDMYRGRNAAGGHASELKISLRAFTKATATKKVRDGTAAKGKCNVTTEVDAAQALKETLAGVDAARRGEGRIAASNSSHAAAIASCKAAMSSSSLLAGVDLAVATDSEAAAMAVEQGLELVEHDDLEHAGASSYTGVTLTSEGTACWRARAKRDSERYGHGNGERVALGNFRSATAAAVTVAQWEHDHPCAAACSANSQVQASS